MYSIRLEENGFVVYDITTKERQNKKPFTNKSKAANYIKDLESGNADESKYHITRGSGRWFNHVKR